jgi:hypothetical protein
MKFLTRTHHSTSQPGPDWFSSDYPSVAIIVATAALLVGVSATTLRSHNLRAAAKPRDCVKLIEDEERLGCYDHAVHRVPSKAPDVPLPGTG